MPEEKVSTTAGREKWWSSTVLSVDRYLGNYLYFNFEIRNDRSGGANTFIPIILLKL